MSIHILVIDNYDSFVFNIVSYLAQLGAECDVVRNDAVPATAALEYAGVLLSPGPGEPRDAGICLDVIARVGGRVPIFGVCLGHQAIAEAFGGDVIRAPELLHGKTSEVFHDGAGVLHGLPNPFTATRYHSLAVSPDTLPADLTITARTASGVIMGLAHRTLDIEGVQFHPESVLTQGGHQMLANWLTRCGASDALAAAEGLAPVLPVTEPVR